MNNLILQLRIEQTKTKKELDELKIKIHRLLNELATLSCPYFEEIEDIKATEIEQIGDELFIVKEKALETQKKLKQLNKDLSDV